MHRSRLLTRMKHLTFLLVVTSLAAASAAEDGVPRWWKGNLHTHTLWSDGDGFPDMVTDWYAANGYDFLALSDHNVLSRGERWLDVRDVNKRANNRAISNAPPVDAFASYVQRFGTNWVQTRPSPLNRETQVRLKPLDELRTRFEQPGKFLMIEAEEITHEAANGRAIHIGAVNVLEAIKPVDGATVREVIEKNLRAVEESAARTGRKALVHVNHPNYKWGVTAEDLAAVINERFFEIWNGVDGDNDPGDVQHPSTDEIWDIANTLRLVGLNLPPLLAVATDDSHDYHNNKLRARPGRAWVMVHTRWLTPESVIGALHAGEFYASTGVVLEAVRFDEKARRLAVTIKADGSETYSTKFVGTRRGVSLSGKPRLDSAGRVVETTLDYRTASGPQIGEVLHEESGLHPSYTLKGDELYVRAVVTSSGAPRVPSSEFPFKRAWTQPVGWRIEAREAK